MPYIVLGQFDQVKNIEGTNQCAPRGFSSWKQYWIHESGRNWASNCRISGCPRSAVGGGHVNINGYYDVYIIPMCNVCNSPQNTSWMMVDYGTTAVKVEEDNTRGPQGPCYR